MTRQRRLLLGLLVLHWSASVSAQPSEPSEEVQVEVETDEAPDAASDDSTADAASDGAGDPEDDGATDANPNQDESDMAESAAPPVDLGPPPEMVVRGTDVSKLAGAGHAVSNKDLERFEHDNAHAVLLSVPGVYVRAEDGFGLRPNIGIRGASSNRTSKVTLMEDGILFAPAPYSAPAAYYFPLVTRMVGVDVFKGPSAVRYGPNTIGGAINMRTRPIPDSGGGFDVAYGLYDTAKLHGHYGLSNDRFGVLLEGVHLESGGFKELDSGGPTGFDKNEFMGKFKVNSDFSAPIYQELIVKVGYANEASNETYFGLTDADFESNPVRRYAATQRDLMTWDRTSVHAAHSARLDRHLTLRTDVYRNDFDRSWERLDGFAGGPASRTVLANPGSLANRPYYDVLTGVADTETADQALSVVTNQRTFVSQGLQTRLEVRSKTGPFKHKAEVGLRYHQDSIVRLHTADRYLMQSRQLVSAGAPTTTVTDNTGSADALAMHVMDDMTVGRLVITAGARVETIHSRFSDRANGIRTGRLQSILVPGLGAFLGLTQDFGLLGGVHRGFSPVSPGQRPEVQPERSTNYEFGARYAKKRSRVELIGFFNDYTNLSGQCTFSSGCAEAQLDEQFNGGSVHIYGLEAYATHGFKVAKRITVPTQLGYTLTRSNFRTSFDSDNPQFGTVAVGDELPYVPQHQVYAMSGVEGKKWHLFASLSYIDRMREQAGQGAIPIDQATGAQVLLDANLGLRPFKAGLLYLKVDNLLGQQVIAARQPRGARPNRPRFAQVGFKYRFR